MLKNKIHSFLMYSIALVRRRIVVAAVLCAVIAGIGGWVFFLARAQTQAGDGTTEAVVFSIAPGENVFAVAGALYGRGIISSPAFFVAYAYADGLANHFQAGTYRIDPALSMGALAHLFVQGPPEISVLIPPGATLKEIDALLARDGIVSAGTLIGVSPGQLVGEFPFLAGAKTLEGFLMPDTYAFYLNEDPRLVARTMVQNFANQTSGLFGSSSAQTVARWVTVASLLEKEVITDRDKALVAGVINNRLADGMPLQIDASVLYGACGGVFVGCPTISAADIAGDTPYNTYRLRGLPPTPISNPSLSSLRAAVHPIASRYLYYLSDPKTGATVFSVTLAQHARNRQAYLGIH